MAAVKIEASWKEALCDEWEEEYFAKLRENYHRALKSSIVLPPPKMIFRAFDLVKFDDVKVVIIGQDPYHNIENGIQQANGLAFSVAHGLRIPPSLQNIFQELHRDLGLEIPTSGDLTPWAKQGVLLLNAILSVEYRKALSHSAFGWEILTNRAIEILSQRREKIVFMLWGNYAKNKKSLIDKSKHFVLEAPHPSPLARGFVGCGHFRKCNEILRANNIPEIDWQI